MATDSIIIRWGANVAGREEMGMGVFMAAIQHYSSLKEKGELEGMSIHIANDGNFADSMGAMIVEGSADQINAVLASDKHRELLTKALHVVHNMTVQRAETGDRVMKRVEQLQAWRKELGV